MKILTGLLTTLLLATLFSFGPGVSQASAACRVTSTQQQSVYVSTNPYGQSDWMAHSANYWVPNSSQSTCNDINLRDFYAFNTIDGLGYYLLPGHNTHVRIRFYPSSGGSYANTWKPVNSAQTYAGDFVVASAVSNGTQYRLEIWPLAGDGYDIYKFKLKD
jgi:hypothetical protein